MGWKKTNTSLLKTLIFQETTKPNTIVDSSYWNFFIVTIDLLARLSIGKMTDGHYQYLNICIFID